MKPRVYPRDPGNPRSFYRGRNGIEPRITRIALAKCKMRDAVRVTGYGGAENLWNPGNLWMLSIIIDQGSRIKNLEVPVHFQ